tara:strand:+ start:91 stop:420 length:330 start_codon:yes stop_codon:yes gene_type:complete
MEQDTFNIHPSEVQSLRDKGEKFIFLDVREAEELEIAKISNSTHIPMGDVPSKVNLLDDEIPIVVFCHHGQRSAMVTQFLRQLDFVQVRNMEGGIEAWALEIDTSVPRY